MSFQLRDYWCGPAALQLALQLRGARRSQKFLAKKLGTTFEGTDSPDFELGLKALKVRYEIHSSDSKRDARAWLELRAPTCPIILCVDSWQHWVCVAGRCGERLWLFDSLSSERNAQALGRYPLTYAKVLRRWRASRRMSGGEGSFYGIALLSF